MGGPGADSQGGGNRAAPRRKTGRVPRPTRHIPWPELFEHHQSVLTGHLKMMDMVHKHCVDDSGNQKMAQECIDRTHDMIRSFRRVVSSFVPPHHNIDRIPLGASSASMYPGYSPADHIYGEAAAEYGRRMAEAKKKGVEVKKGVDGHEYVVGQSSLSAKEQIEAIHKEREQAKLRKAPADVSSQASKKGVGTTEGDPMEDVQETGEGLDLFVIDSNPTPLDQLQGIYPTNETTNKANDNSKRRVSFQDKQVNGIADSEMPKSKKAKTVDSDTSSGKAEMEPEDDFEEAVKARLKEKEEKRRRKEEKKRKRESDSSQIVHTESTTPSGVISPDREAPTTQKPKKKKAKKLEDDEESATSAAKISEEKAEKKKMKRLSTESGDADHPRHGETKRKKKKQQ